MQSRSDKHKWPGPLQSEPFSSSTKTGLEPDYPAISARTAARAACASPPSGPPPCAMSGRPPPPLPPSFSTPTRTRSTELKRSVRSSVTPAAIEARPSVTAITAEMPLPMRFLFSSTNPRNSLGSSPSITCPIKATSPMVSGPLSAAAAPPPPSASAFFASASSRSSLRA